VGGLLEDMIVAFPKKRDVQYMHKSSGTKMRPQMRRNELRIARIGFWTHIPVWPVYNIGLTGWFKTEILQIGNFIEETGYYYEQTLI
jgi:hypothetical protein